MKSPILTSLIAGGITVLLAGCGLNTPSDGEIKAGAERDYESGKSHVIIRPGATDWSGMPGHEKR